MVCRSIVTLACILSVSSCKDQGTVTSEDDLLAKGSSSVGDYEAIHILPQTATLSAGRTINFEVLGLLPYGNSQVLNSEGTWTISDPSVLAVSEEAKGRIRALKAGSAEVTFSLEGLSKTAAVIVSDKTLDKLKLSEETIQFDVENVNNVVIPKSFSATLQGLYSDGTVEDLSLDGEWICSEPLIVACEGGGKFKVLGVGTSQVRVKLIDLETILTVNVVTHDATFTGFEVSPSPLIIERNSPQSFSVTARFSNGETLDLSSTATLSWSAPALLTIQGGSSQTVTGVALGGGSLSVAWAGEQVSVPYQVIDPLVSQLLLESPTKSFQLAKGETERFFAKLLYNDGTIHDVSSLATFTSSRPAILGIEASSTYGTFRALTTGTASLSVSLGSMRTDKSVTVNNASLTAIELTSVASGTLALNLSRTFVAKARMSDNSLPTVTGAATWTVESLGGNGSFTSSGVFLGTQIGTVRLRAQFLGASAFVDISVGPAVPISIEILPRPSSGSNLIVSRAGGNVQLSAEITYSDGTIVTQTNTLEWTYVITGSGYSFAGFVKNNSGEKGLLVPLADGNFKAEASVGGVTGFRVVGVVP